MILFSSIVNLQYVNKINKELNMKSFEMTLIIISLIIFMLPLFIYIHGTIII